MNKADFEIIFVNNSYKDMRIAKVFSVFSSEFPDVDMKYVSAPIPGLSFARNIGMYAASGEVLLYIDDDAVANPDWAEQMYSVFSENPNCGVVGGQVVLIPPEPRPIDFEEGLGHLWGELKFSSDEFRIVKNEFPSGVNFGMRANILRQMGGFRNSYGLIRDGVARGAVAVVCSLTKMSGLETGLCPAAIVGHLAERERFSLAHIENVTISRILNQYRMQQDAYMPQDWDENYIAERIKAVNNELRSIPENTLKYAQKHAEKQGFMKVWELMQGDVADVP
jgi:glycosyltransferase involved in cell wall biosynthesis